MRRRYDARCVGRYVTYPWQETPLFEECDLWGTSVLAMQTGVDDTFLEAREFGWLDSFAIVYVARTDDRAWLAWSLFVVALRLLEFMQRRIVPGRGVFP